MNLRPPISRLAAPLLAAAGFLLSLIYLFRQLGAAPSALGIWINSDTLWMANVFTDIFHDHYSLTGWAFSIAPCWFPDFACVGIFWLMTGNVVLATLFAGFIQILLLAGALHLCRKAMSGDSPVLQDTLLLGIGVALALYVGNQPGRVYPAFYEFFLPQTHIGSLIMVLYALGLGLLWIRSGTPSKTVAGAYAMVCFLAGMSNVLFFAHFLVPFTAALSFAGFRKTISWRTSKMPVAFGWSGAAAGIPINRLVLHASDVDMQAGMSRSRIAASFAVFCQGLLEKLRHADLLHLLAILWLAVCLALSLYSLRDVKRLKEPAARDRKLTWLFFTVCLLSSLCGLAAIIVGGSNGLADFKNYTWTMHYWHPTFLMPLFGFPVALALRLSSMRQRVALPIAILCVLGPIFAIATGPPPSVHLASFTPPLVNFIDDLAARKSLHYGYASYWQARPIAMLSKRGVRAYAVDGVLNPLFWVSNREWYKQSVEDRTKPPRIDFVILDDVWNITREAVVRALGQPLEEISFEKTSVLIFPAGAAEVDEPLNVFRQEISSTIRSLQLHTRQQTVVPVDIQNPGPERWSSTGKNPITVSYKWFHNGKMLPVEGERTVLPRAIGPGSSAAVDVRVVAVDKPGRYALRITLVQEGVAWFMTQSAMYLELPVTVK